MRLLNTETKRLTEFESHTATPYAILSHVWEREEVSFQDIAHLDRAGNMRGFAKIAGACNTAKRGGFKYIWIDTCCINKESSAELSEAINSMYMWYKNARVCYVYLWDVPSDGDHENLGCPFSVSVWFTRGWTLQELIAPAVVMFYGRDWEYIGTKITLQEVISAVTGIGAEFVTRRFALDDVPVAVRISWAADRHTARVEDVAYSLMGLFDVNMPLLYGEGGKAFIRLQHEIIKKSTDHSIFAWTAESREEWPFLPTGSRRRGILARSPREFRNSDKVERILPASLSGGALSALAPYSITNQGLNITLPIVEVGKETLAFLNCRFSGRLDPIVITLAWSHDMQRYVRSTTMGLNRISTDPRGNVLLYIADDYYSDDGVGGTGITLTLKVHMYPDYGKPQIIFSTGLCQNSQDPWSFISNPLGYSDFLIFDEPDKPETFAVVVGAQEPGVVWCDILENMRLSRHDFHENSIRDIYCTPTGAFRETRKRSFDKVFARLTDEWSVTTSLASRSKFEFEGRVEIKRLRKYPPLHRPFGKVGYMVISPSPDCGFTVDLDFYHQKPALYFPLDWVQHSGSFISYIAGKGVRVLPFNNGKTGDKFYLAVCRFHNTGSIYSCIVDGVPPEKIQEEFGKLERRAQTGTYSTKLYQGASVFVTYRQCKDDTASLVDHVIIVSL